MNSDPRTRAVKSTSYAFLDMEAELAKGNTSIRPVTHIYIDQPPIGFKGHLMLSRGVFVLERGPCVWQTFFCTHTGSGGFSVFDGVPDEDGFFHEPSDQKERDEYGKDPNRQGKKLLYANPAILGSMQLGIGCLHGLTVKVDGMQEGDNGAPVIGLSWMPVKVRPK